MTPNQFPGHTLAPVPPTTLLGGDDEFSAIQKINQLLFNLVASGGGSGITQLTGDVIAGPGSGSVAAAIANQLGNSGKFLTTDGLVTSWSAVSGGTGLPGGLNGQLQYNNGGVAFGGITGATTDGTVLTLVAPILGTPASVNLTNGTALPLTTGVTGVLPNSNTTATTANSAGAIVQRDGTGNFSAGTISANLSGTATSATALTNGRTISITGDLAYTSQSFNGSASVTGTGTLATVNSNVGSFTNASITVNAKGLVTAASSGSAGGVTSIAGTANEIAASASTGAVTLSLSTALTFTGKTVTGGTFASVTMTAPILGTPVSGVLSNCTTATQSPADNSTKLASTAYVDLAVLGQDYKQAAKYTTTTALPTVVYNNGSSGVGATLTGVSVGVLGIDSSTPSVGDRVLIKNQSSTFQNGIYTVTAVGSVAAVFVLTRATDFNQSSEINAGDSLFVSAGTTLATTTWAYNAGSAPVIGTDPITFAQTAGQGSFTAGNGISITGVSIAIDTSVTVDKTTAQTLTTKTLTSPVITTAINTQTSSYALVSSDAGKWVQMNSGSANTLTVPKDATQTIAVGSQVIIENLGSGLTSIAPEDVTITINSRGNAFKMGGGSGACQYATAVLTKTAANTWNLSGDISA